MIEQLYILPILLFSVVIHELAHGWMALKLGDPTAKMMGRLTLNPIPHIDLIGSIIVPLFSLIMAGQIFIAWAKPVPVNPLNFSNYRRDDILVSVVGPLSNLVLAFLCTLLFIVTGIISPYFVHINPLFEQGFNFLLSMFAGGITLNIVLGVFNLIPIPPLDGSHVIASLLPEDLNQNYQRIGFFGIFIILILMRWPPFHFLFINIIKTLTTPFQMIINIFF